MKLYIIAFISVFSFQIANACIGEAQLIAAVKDAKIFSEDICLVKIGQIQSYQDNLTCEGVLDVEEVASQGIQTLVNDDGVCEYSAGESISGIVSKNLDGSISL